ncbi:hypothetical protein D3C81_700930 [compost metagenome]
MPGAQHHLLIVQGRFLLLRFTQLEHTPQASAVENRQAQLRPDTETARIPPAKIGQLQRLKANAA